MTLKEPAAIVNIGPTSEICFDPVKPLHVGSSTGDAGPTRDQGGASGSESPRSDMYYSLSSTVTNAPEAPMPLQEVGRSARCVGVGTRMHYNDRKQQREATA
mgnify:CR=1 FL=1